MYYVTNLKAIRRLSQPELANMSSSKRNGKSKTSTQENVRDNVDNCTMQTRKQSITTKVTKPRTADNVTRNTGRLVGKIPLSNPNRRGKKINLN